MGAYFIDQQVYAVLYMVIACLLMAIGYLVLIRDTAKLSNIFYFLMNVFAGLSIMTVASDIANITFVNSKALNSVLPYFFGAAVPPLMYFFSLTFTRSRVVLSNLTIATTLALYAVLAIFLYLFPGVFIESRMFGVNGGILYGVYVLYVLGFIFASFRVFIRKYKSSAGVFKSVLRTLILGIVSFGSIVLLAGLLMEMYNLETFRLVQYISITFLSSYVGYRIIQYHRWRLKPFVAELFVSFITLSLFSQILFASSTFDRVVSVIVLLLFLVAGYFLVKSIGREAKAKDEIEKLVKDLTEANEKLQMLDKRKSEFVKISAHHLKAPLTAIKGYASMILEGSFGRTVNKDAQEAIQKIYDASERLVAIISDFMDISNIESGKMEYAFERVNLKKLIEGVLEEMKMVVEKSGLDVSFNTDAIDGYMIYADPGKLRQVISNLTDNAIKYTPQGHVHLFLKKHVNENKIHLTITDTGIGMSQETIDNLFEKFSRAHDANKVNTGGSGLGLYVAKEIMKKHEARIWVESPGEGKGSTFHLEFEAK
jgi:signal transduction histidine kinase